MFRVLSREFRAEYVDFRSEAVGSNVEARPITNIWSWVSPTT